MKKQMLIGLSAAVGILGSMSVYAEDLSYSYLAAGYEQLDLEGVDFDGYSLAGSIRLHRHVFAGAEYSEVSELSVDIDRSEATIGGIFPVHEAVDLTLEAGYLEYGIDAVTLANVAGSEDGYLIRAGVRGLVSERFELNAHAGREEIGDGTGKTLSIGALYSFNEGFSVELEFSRLDIDDLDLDWDQLGLSMQYTY